MNTPRTAGLLLAGLLLAACGLAAAQAPQAPATSPAGPAAAPGPAPQAQAGPPASVSIGRNVYMAGAQVRPAGPVGGDFAGVGGRVIVDEPVEGDAAVAGGAVDVRAPIGDDVRAAGASVSIESTVAGELVASGGMVTLTQDATVARGATLYGGEVRVDGRVQGPLRVGAQRIVVNGVVGGNARLEGGEIALGPQARIQGDLVYASPTPLERAEGAVVTGAVTRQAGDWTPRGERRFERRFERRWEYDGTVAGWVGGVVSYLALLACGAVLLLVLPAFSSHSADRLRESPWLALAIGFGTVVAVPILALLLFITLLGIPLGIAVLALYPVLLLAGFVVGVLFIARLLAAALRKPEPARLARNLGWFALALLAVMLVAQLPFVGGLLVALVGLLGIGACILEIYRRRQGAALQG